MNSFEKAISGYLGEANLKKLQAVTVGIAGCGGLGSNCANNLARSGIKQFILADFDRVELSNLNRQYYFRKQVGRKKVEALAENLLAINPDLSIKKVCEKLQKDNILSIFEACNIVVEAFDKANYKSLLVTTLLTTDKFIVSASGLAGYGNSDDIKIHRLKTNLVVVGDLKSEIGPNLPALSPRVNVAAAKQADVVLEYILKKL